MFLNKTESACLFGIFTKACKLSPASASSVLFRMREVETHKGSDILILRMKSMINDLITPGTNFVLWRGDWKPLLALSCKGRIGLRRSLKILKTYGRWKCPVVKQAHFNTFFKTITSPNLSPVETTEVTCRLSSSLLTQDASTLSAASGFSSDFSYFYPLGGKKSPTVGFISKERSSILPSEHVEACLLHCPNLLRDHYGFLSGLFAYSKPKASELPDVVGKVTPLTKDRGNKVRFVANPFLMLQFSLSRLKAACRDYLETTYPESLVFDQDKCEEWVLANLKKGVAMTSLDLTSCSDLLPADPQFDLLRLLFPSLEEDISLFKTISRSLWLFETPNGPAYCGWNVGQPLGTDPSFFGFTIFLSELIRSCGGDANSFRIIGDDVILTSTISERVCILYEKIHLSINHSKSIFSSPYYVEFAGRLFSRTGDLGVFKASPRNLNTDSFGYLRQYGLSGLKLLPEKYRKMVACTAAFVHHLRRGDRLRFIPEAVYISLDCPKNANIHDLDDTMYLHRNVIVPLCQRVLSSGNPDFSIMVTQPDVLRYLLEFLPRKTRTEKFPDAFCNESLDTLVGVGIWIGRAMDIDKVYDFATNVIYYNALVAESPSPKEDALFFKSMKTTILKDSPSVSQVEPDVSFSVKKDSLSYAFIIWRKTCLYFNRFLSGVRKVGRKK